MIKRKAETFPPSLRRLDVIKEDEEVAVVAPPNDMNIYEDVEFLGSDMSLSDGGSEYRFSEVDEATLEFEKIMNDEELHYEPYHSSSSDLDADFATCEADLVTEIVRRSMEIGEARVVKIVGDYEPVMVSRADNQVVVREVSVRECPQEDATQFDLICKEDGVASDENFDDEFDEICNQQSEGDNTLTERELFDSSSIDAKRESYGHSVNDSTLDDDDMDDLLMELEISEDFPSFEPQEPSFIQTDIYIHENAGVESCESECSVTQTMTENNYVFDDIENRHPQLDECNTVKENLLTTSDFSEAQSLSSDDAKTDQNQEAEQFTRVQIDFEKTKPRAFTSTSEETIAVKNEITLAKLNFLRTPLEDQCVTSETITLPRVKSKELVPLAEEEINYPEERQQLSPYENLELHSSEIISKFSSKLEEVNETVYDRNSPVIMEQINLFARRLIDDDENCADDEYASSKSLFEANKDKLVSFIKEISFSDEEEEQLQLLRDDVQDVPNLLRILEENRDTQPADTMAEEERTLTSLETVTQRLAEVLQNSLRRGEFAASTDAENNSARCEVSSLSSAAAFTLSTPLSPPRSRSLSLDSNTSQGTTVFVPSTCSSACSSGWSRARSLGGASSRGGGVKTLRRLCVEAVGRLPLGRELMLDWGLATADDLKILRPDLARGVASSAAAVPVPPARWYPTGVGAFAVGLSPAQQRAEPQLTRERAALLLDLHCKFAQRRAYHEAPPPPPRSVVVRMGVDQQQEEHDDEVAAREKMLADWLEDEMKIDESHTQSVLTTARKFEVERYHISKQRDIAVEIQGQRQFRMIKEQVEQQMLEDEQRQQLKSDEHHQQQMAQDDGSGAASPAAAHPPVLQHQLLEEFASARMAEAAQANGHADTMPAAFYFGNNSSPTTTTATTPTTVPTPNFKAKAPSPGVWSPKPGRALSSNPLSPTSLASPTSSFNDEPPPPPVWTPKASPTLERKEFRPVRFESSTPPPRPPPAFQEQVVPPFDLVPAQSREQASTNISHSLDRKLTLNIPKLPRAQNPTVTLLQKAREGQLPKGAIYLDHKMSAKEDQQHEQQHESSPPVYNPNDILFQVQKVEKSEDRKLVQLSPRQYDGIGPTTKDGMPLILRSGVKEENYGKWYKRMYDSLHKAGRDDDHITIKYKPNSRRGHSGYASEPEPVAGYDSDVATGYSDKYATLDRRRIKNKESDFTSVTMPRSRGLSESIKYACEVYKNQPGRIEDYEPGRSSISEKEAKLHATENPSIAKKQYMANALKEGYDSDSQLIFKKREEREAIISPVEQKIAYKSIQSGGEVPLHGLRKSAPEKPKEPDALQSFFDEFERDKESPHKFVECGDVTIHYKSPVRGLARDAPLSEDELARRQEEAMRRIYQEERRRKYLQELHDIESRRHTDNFTPSQKSPIPLNRYDDFFEDIPSRRDRTPEPKMVARALYNFVGQSPRELTFRRGDVILVRRQIDKNWYEGEHNASIGLFPFNYVEIIPQDGARTISKGPCEGKARAKFNFVAQSSLELSLVKGEMVVLTRRVDDNWYEGRIGLRRGIFPCTYVEVINEPGERLDAQKPMPKFSGTYLNGSSAPFSGHSSISSSRYLPYMNQTLHIDTRSEPLPYRALYNYKPQNEDELELREGDTVFVMEKCDDGWFVGTSNRSGHFGTFPGNYVERI